MGSSAQAEIAFLPTAAGTIGCGPLSGLLNRLACAHPARVLTERVVWPGRHLQLRLLVGLKLRTHRLLLLSLLRLWRWLVLRHGRRRWRLGSARPCHSWP